jgi:hypothetical protein
MAASSVAVREQMPSLPAGTGMLSTDDGRYVQESGEALFGDHGAYSFSSGRAAKCSPRTTLFLSPSRPILLWAEIAFNGGPPGFAPA